ncbi:MAG: hypothetical protein QOJ17_1454 [Rhodospirillaceae bacterium]|nr:hypothetical protein [Rhodospirillaceae bacterium]
MALIVQAPLKFKSVHAWHRDVADQACRIIRMGRAQEGLRRSKAVNAISERLQQIFDRPTHVIIVVYD